MSLTREQIKSANDVTLVEVEVPEWGGSVFVRSLSGADMARVQKRFEQTKDDEKFSPMLIACLADEDGNQLFTDSDIPWLKEKSMRVLIDLVNACNTVNGFDDEETEKNLEAT